MFGQTLPISLNISKFDPTLLTASSDLKEFINSYTNHKEFFNLQERHDNMELNPNKKFFSDNYIVDIFMFIFCNNFPTGYNFDSIFIMLT